MATLYIKDEIYEQLVRKAVAQKTTVEGFVQPLLDRLAETDLAHTPPSLIRTNEERQAALNEWMAEVQKRANRYPPGFALDDSRETIYKGCGE